MKTAVVALVLLGLAAYASAECANACSGHGRCGTKDQCTCFPNWMAADCSERVCPYGLAWVDTPRGDLNHDGVRSLGAAGMVSVMSTNKNEYEIYPTDSSTVKDATSGEAHFYTECSNKGLCDREFGVCKCFDGYTGSSCQRTVCPNDCSGHGVCRTVEEIALNVMNTKKTDSAGGENFYTGMSSSEVYRLWDMDKAQSCVCDHGYSGPDCSRRECPRGDDPLTHRAADCGGNDCANEVQQVVLSGAAAGDWFYIKFTEWTGFEWRTDVFEFGEDACIGNGDEGLARVIKDQLQAVPNSVFEEIDVVVTVSAGVSITVEITFVENPGNIAQMEWINDARLQTLRGDTCVSAADTTADYTAVVTTTTAGNTDRKSVV